MMYRTIALIAALSLSLTKSVGGFSLGSVGFCRPATTTSFSTCLFAEGSDAEETETTTTDESSVAEDSAPDSSNDILNSPAFLKRKLDVIKSDIAKAEEDIQVATAQLEAGKAEWSQQFDDLESEFQNIQNRFSRQGSQGDETATINVARKFLDLLDNFDRAFKAVAAETEEEKIVEAKYKAAYDNVLHIFKDLGVTEVETVGTEFDYEVHQAVMQRPSDEFEEGVVCEELQKGYILGEKLIRAAMVSVAA